MAPCLLRQATLASKFAEAAPVAAKNILVIKDQALLLLFIIFNSKVLFLNIL